MFQNCTNATNPGLFASSLRLHSSVRPEVDPLALLAVGPAPHLAEGQLGLVRGLALEGLVCLPSVPAVEVEAAGLGPQGLIARDVALNNLLGGGP